METSAATVQDIPSCVQDVHRILSMELRVLDALPICDEWRYREGGYVEVRSRRRSAVRSDGARVPPSYMLPAREGQVHCVSHSPYYICIIRSSLQECCRILRLKCRYMFTDRI